MILFIDTSDPVRAKLILFLLNKKLEHYFSADQLSENLLPEIEKLLNKQKGSIKDLTTLAVVVGPGSFSKIRTGVATANALAFGLGIKVIAVRAEEQVSFLKLSQKNSLAQAEPFYDREPNITMARSRT